MYIYSQVCEQTWFILDVCLLRYLAERWKRRHDKSVLKRMFPGPTSLQCESVALPALLSGGAKWKNLPDFGLFFPIFSLFLDFFQFFLSFSRFFPSFSKFLTISLLSGGALCLPCPYTGYATGVSGLVKIAVDYLWYCKTYPSTMYIYSQVCKQTWFILDVCSLRYLAERWNKRQ